MSNTSADAQAASTSSFLTSLVVNSAIAGGELVAFIFARRLIKAVYEPRTYIPPKDEQAAVLGRNLFWPLWNIIKADPEEILRKNGVDPYVFVRFLIMMSKAMIPIWLLSWAILLPVDAVKSSRAGISGLDKFTFGNVAPALTDRLWAHLILAWVFNGWLIYLIWGEMEHWLVVRQEHLINPAHSKLPQANTVLVTGIHMSYMDEDKLAQLFSRFPGGVKRIWLNRNLNEMPGLWERRATAAQALEAAQVKLIRFAQQHRMEVEKKVAKLQKKNKSIPKSLTGPVNPQLYEEGGEGGEGKILNLADQLVPRAKRPTRRLKPSWAPFGLGLLGIGQKVDTIEWARNEIAECEPKLAASRAQLVKDINTPGVGEEEYPPLNSAFIHFNQQIAAHMAAQCVAHDRPSTMSGRYVEQSPSNVIWRNLSLNPYELVIRRAISYAATGGLILAWTFPVAFVGTLSNITTLTDTFSWLSWIKGDSFGKKVLQGVISGVLPPVLLALLMLLLPFILRQLAALEGIPSKTLVELDLMTRYFIFLVIHTFFVVTLSSGLISAVKPLAQNPSSVATILAKQLPTASTFFVTLILTQFTGTAGTLLQPISLVLYYVRVVLGGGTPRSVFRSRYRLGTTSWGTQFPGVTVYAVIMVGYCIISPIINGFAAAFFALSAIVYKYLFIWVQDQPPQQDTGGAFFPKAITHVFVGMYVQEVALTALFFLVRDENKKVAAIPQAVLTIVLIVCTAAIHFTLNQSYRPLMSSLPLSLAHLSYGMPKETGDEASIIGEEDEIRAMADSSRDHLTGTMQRPESSSPASLPPPKTPTRGFKAEDFIPSSVGRRTAARPPLGMPHETDMELGTFGQYSDPAGDPDAIEEPYFAVPGGPGIQGHGGDEADDPNAFFHPATKEPMRILWLPKDELGLCDAEIEANASKGIESVNRYAILNAKAKVHISGPPPDEF